MVLELTWASSNYCETIAIVKSTTATASTSISISTERKTYLPTSISYFVC